MKDTKGDWFILALALFLMAPGLAICGFFYHSAELTCSRADDGCTIVRTTPLGATRVSFRLSSITGVERTSQKRSHGASTGGASHIALHTQDGERHLTGYDTGIGKDRMDKNVKEINNFIAGNAAQTLVIRQDDRIIALASLPFFFVSLLIFIALVRKRRSEEKYRGTSTFRSGDP